MSNLIYLTLKGEKQGLISAGCSSFDSIGNKYQSSHKDQIMIYSLTHSMSREEHIAHMPINIIKPIDKSTPMLGIAISNNERLDLLFDLYRTSSDGGQEKFFSIEARKSHIKHIGVNYPHIITHEGNQPEEMISFSYDDIKWTHHIAGTTGYSIRHDMFY